MSAPTLVSQTADRVRGAIAGVGAALLGAAPHLLHHAGPFAGAALLAGATGKMLFGALGLVLAIPVLRRLRTRTGSWRAPGAALPLMAALFTVSTVVIGPALTGDDEPVAPPTREVPATISPAGHDSHHRSADPREADR